MKKLLLLSFLIINVHVFAQKQQAFFSIDSAGIKNIVTLVMEETKNKYQFDRVIAQKWDVEYWYRYDKHNLVRIHFEFLPDRSAILKGLSGRYEDIFPFWKKYFQADADSAVIEKAGSVKSAPSNFSKGEIVYSFRKLAKPMWQIRPFSLVDPNKK